MILAYLICGIAMGLISVVITLLLGFGILFALLAYVLGGFTGLLLAVALMWRSPSDELVGLARPKLHI